MNPAGRLVKPVHVSTTESLCREGLGDDRLDIWLVVKLPQAIKQPGTGVLNTRPQSELDSVHW